MNRYIPLLLLLAIVPVSAHASNELPNFGNNDLVTPLLNTFGFDSMEDAITHIFDELSDIEDVLTSLQTRVGTLENSLRDEQANIADIEERLESVEEEKHIMPLISSAEISLQESSLDRKLQFTQFRNPAGFYDTPVTMHIREYSSEADSIINQKRVTEKTDFGWSLPEGAEVEIYLRHFESSGDHIFEPYCTLTHDKTWAEACGNITYQGVVSGTKHLFYEVTNLGDDSGYVDNEYHYKILFQQPFYP